MQKQYIEQGRKNTTKLNANKGEIQWMITN